MAAVSLDHNDNDSEYGWDLSPEDEEQIHALIARASSPAWASTASTARHLGDTSSSSTTRAEPLAAGHVPTRNDVFASEPARPVSNLAALGPGFSRDEIPGGTPSQLLRHGDGETPGMAFPGVSSPPLVSISSAVVDQVIYPSLSSAISISNIGPDSGAGPRRPDLDVDVDVDATSRSKSPLARFRTYPKKPFSVTELASGAWCELQYEYTLNLRGGRKRRTAAMKSGSKIHQTLEYEVHPPVKIDVLSKEDAFGLRIWNMIQGLRTLRDEGLTREMEIWGLVNGHVVNGVIDVLSYGQPDDTDPDFRSEDEVMGAAQQAAADAAEQPRITKFFPGSSKEEVKDVKAPPPPPKIYITDVKTRGSKTIPVKPSLVRPTKIQLFLYHRFLSEMASDRLDLLFIIRRYGLDPDAIFSDAFIAQIGGMHTEVFFDVASSPVPVTALPTEHPASTQPDPDLIRYKTIRSLIPLLRDELRLTFPEGTDSLGATVKVEYRYRPWGGAGGAGGDDEEDAAAGQVIGCNTIPVDDESLQSFLDHYMKWWQGERPAVGVDIEDASIKCRNCDFADMCQWRQEQDKERLQRVREKLAGKAADEAVTEKIPRRSPRGKGKVADE